MLKQILHMQQDGWSENFSKFIGLLIVLMDTTDRKLWKINTYMLGLIHNPKANGNYIFFMNRIVLILLCYYCFICLYIIYNHIVLFI